MQRGQGTGDRGQGGRDETQSQTPAGRGPGDSCLHGHPLWAQPLLHACRHRSTKTLTEALTVPCARAPRPWVVRGVPWPEIKGETPGRAAWLRKRLTSPSSPLRHSGNGQYSHGYFYVTIHVLTEQN